MQQARKNEQGVYLVFFALSVFVLFGFVALAVDLARQIVVHNELQNAADACAISAVTELNNSPDSINRAVLAGEFVGNQNLEDFQGSSVSFQSSNLSFGTSINSTFIDANSSPNYHSRFVKCQASSSGFLHFFAGVLGVPESVLTASAVATLLPSSTVASLPLAINKGAGAGALGYSVGDIITFSWNKTGTITASVAGSTMTVTAATTFVDVNSVISGTGVASGTKVISRLTGTGLTGTYQLNQSLTLTSRSLTVTAPSANSFYFANEASVSNANLEIQRFGLLNSNLSGSITAPSYGTTISGGGNNLTSFEDAWNSRFGLYRSGTLLSATTLPDLSGYYSAAPSSSTWTDYATVQEPARSAANTLSPYTAVSSTVLTNRGASNRRYIVLPVVSGALVQGWACTLIVHPEVKGSITDNSSAKIQFIGSASSLDSPCRGFGLAGNQTTGGPLVPTIVQ